MKNWTRDGASINSIYEKELDFYRTAGPVVWHEDKDGYSARACAQGPGLLVFLVLGDRQSS